MDRGAGRSRSIEFPVHSKLSSMKHRVATEIIRSTFWGASVLDRNVSHRNSQGKLLSQSADSGNQVTPKNPNSADERGCHASPEIPLGPDVLSISFAPSRTEYSAPSTSIFTKIREQEPLLVQSDSSSATLSTFIVPEELNLPMQLSCPSSNCPSPA